MELLVNMYLEKQSMWISPAEERTIDIDLLKTVFRVRQRV